MLLLLLFKLCEAKSSLGSGVLSVIKKECTPMLQIGHFLKQILIMTQKQRKRPLHLLSLPSSLSFPAIEKGCIHAPVTDGQYGISEPIREEMP